LPITTLLLLAELLAAVLALAVLVPVDPAVDVPAAFVVLAVTVVPGLLVVEVPLVEGPVELEAATNN